MNAENPTWVAATPLPYISQWAAMYTVGEYLYILGGWSDDGVCRNYHYRIKDGEWEWKSRAAYERNIFRHTAVVDEVQEKIYVLGGNDCVHNRAEVRIYDPAANSWSSISNLPWADLDYSAAIITQKNEERWLVVQKRDYHQIRTWNLDTNTGWHHVVDTGSNPKNGQGRMISMTPYTAFMLGAETSTYGTNLANFFVYDPETYKFRDIKRFVPNEHVWGFWTTVKRKKQHRVFTNCLAERTYAAVGWGGTDLVIF